MPSNKDKRVRIDANLHAKAKAAAASKRTSLENWVAMAIVNLLDSQSKD